MFLLGNDLSQKYVCVYVTVTVPIRRLRRYICISTIVHIFAVVSSFRACHVEVQSPSKRTNEILMMIVLNRNDGSCPPVSYITSRCFPITHP